MMSEEKKDQEYMELLQKYIHLKKLYENLAKQYETAIQKVCEIQKEVESYEARAAKRRKMKMNYEITHKEYYDEKGNTIFVGLFIDKKEFILDIDDLLEISDILKTVAKNMDDFEGDMVPNLNLYECLVCPLRIFEDFNGARAN